MFKRVEKRRLKKEEEEALGLDEDMKEILGMHDTDSEESASDSDDSDVEKDSDREGDEEGSDLEALEHGPEDMDQDEDEQGDSEEEGDDEEDPDVSVEQALKDPIYVVSVMPEIKACVICPGKILKSVKMVQLHRTSNAHERRAKQFKTLAADADPRESAWGILQRHADDKPTFATTPSASGESKRALKKKAHTERQKQRRERQKLKRTEAAKKKKEAAPQAAAASGSSTSTPADPSAPVDTPKSEKSNSKSAKSKTKKAKDGAKHPEPVDSNSPPKKKRKVATAKDEGDDRAGVDAAPKVPAPSISGSAVHKEKRGKGRPRVAPEDASDEMKQKSKDTVDSVKSIVRSTSDRAKNARARALSAVTKGGSKNATKARKKVTVS